jgi:hypothetical protein
MKSSIRHPLTLSAVLPLVIVLAAACGDSDPGSNTDGGTDPDGGTDLDGGTDPDGGLHPDGGLPTTPKVLSTTPINEATDVPLNGTVGAAFSEAMDPTTLTATTFMVTSGAAVQVPGTMVCSGSAVVFRPAALLASQTLFTAIITTEARSAAGVALATSHTWTFTTGQTVIPLLPVELGTAGGFVILSKSAISTVPTSDITGDVGVSPAAASFITGFSLVVDAAGAFSISTQVTGHVLAADYAAPTPSNLTAAVGAMELAFTEAAGRAPDVTELGAGNIGGMTLEPGVYQWGTGLLVPTDLTLAGSATDVWIFQVAGNLELSSAARVVLSGGALPRNVFWQVAGLVELGTTSHLEGVVLSQTSITLRTGASVNGRLLAQTAVALDSVTVVEPTP